LSTNHHYSDRQTSTPRLILDDNNPLRCTVCGRIVPDPSIANGDVLYIPYFEGDSDEHLAAEIERTWHVDPYADFGVCEQCIEGHCGAVPGLNAETWLAKRVKELQRHQLL
jgi:hypothetical protein